MVIFKTKKFFRLIQKIKILWIRTRLKLIKTYNLKQHCAVWTINFEKLSHRFKTCTVLEGVTRLFSCCRGIINFVYIVLEKLGQN